MRVFHRPRLLQMPADQREASLSVRRSREVLHGTAIAKQRPLAGPSMVVSRSSVAVRSGVGCCAAQTPVIGVGS